MFANGFTLASFLSIVFASIHFQIERRELERSILPSTTISQEGKLVRAWALRIAAAIYINEVQILMEKETGLWMVAYKLHLGQLEDGKISSLKTIYQTNTPELWKLCHQLLDVWSKTGP